MTICCLASDGFAELNVDFCSFRGADDSNYIELYLSIPRTNIEHHRRTDGYFGAINFDVLISRKDEILAQDGWYVKDIEELPQDIGETQLIIDARTYKLPSGVYQFVIEASDSLSSRSWVIKKEVNVKSFDPLLLTVSDIEFGAHVLPGGLIDRFDRGEFTLIPAAEHHFGLARQYFYYYLEIYPPVDSKTETEYIINRIITDQDSQVVFSTQAEMPAGPEPFSDLDSISVVRLTSGEYDLRIEVTDKAENKAVAHSSFSVEQLESIVIPRVFMEMDSVQVSEELDEVEFLLASRKFKHRKKMTLDEMRRLLGEFWLRYDNDRSTNEIPLRDQFDVIVAEADRRYKTSRLRGHQTDRGRIYFHYGDPDTRETYPIELGTKPYEIWHYDSVEGGVIFVFVDRSGRGEFSLAHSTKRGEINHPTWYEDYVTRMGPRSRR